jgi:predicted ATP-grasp superfamily ATP-dependent carboligase
VSSVCGEFRFPVIVKPRRTSGIAFPGKNFVANSAADLTQFFEERSDLMDQAVAQEVVPSGDGRIVMAVSYSGRDGRVLAQATCRKLRQWPPDYGVTSLGRSEFLPDVASLNRHFLNVIGYEGFAATEFAEDFQSGRYFLLEVNPRLNLPIQLILDAKVDLIGTAYREMSQPHHVVAVPAGQIDGLYWIDFGRDLFSFLNKFRRGRVGLLEWLRSMLLASSYATFDLRDMKPYLASSLGLVRDLVAMLGGHLRARLRSVVLWLRSRLGTEA